MRKIVVLNRMSLDGYFAGPNGEIDWFIHDPQVDLAAHRMMDPDTLLFGRVTYQMFVQFWPQVKNDPHAAPEALATANELDQMKKVVFSKTLKEVSWVNTQWVKEDMIEWVSRLKQGSGPDISLFGSGSIMQQLAQRGLIEEYLIILSPVLLGSGKALFKDVQKSSLKWVESRHFDSGNVLLHYQTIL